MSIENLKALRQVGNQILSENKPIGFGRFDCGTYACLAGWYNRMTDANIDLNGGGWEDLANHFGITGKQSCALFTIDYHDRWILRELGPTQFIPGGNKPGKEAYNVLRSRLKYLDSIIAEAIPDNVIEFRKAA